MERNITLELRRDLKTGERRLAGHRDEVGLPLDVAGTLPLLRAGERLDVDGKPFFRVLGTFWSDAGSAVASKRMVQLECLMDASAGEAVSANIVSEGFSLAWITLSDKGCQGKRRDESGPLIAEMVAEKMSISHAQGFILPDEERQLRHLITDLALGQGFDMIMTTGGTGVAPRDITPEATLAVIEKRLPGYERAMTAASLAKTPHGAVSRAVAGTLGGALVVNMPGSPKAVRECLEPLLPTLAHTLEKLHGDPSDCAVLRC
ncbi:MogA/MoaB family molybdenum cofactor biosynthesis protein [Desulfovibrio oxyclinae]|uniref:MogA/MoaB family molybdenum cofactor biosynthesis protein n=1 Tax=Desulfovibrio oxyclinae TaxID=63560 RepID=UPI00036FE983|nr:MogA/MoaB family molybdenum cofactor biosynthesis protein [Desulfovibrio oxyclinae]